MPQPGTHRNRFSWSLLAAICLLPLAAAPALASEAMPETNSRSPYVHRINLYDVTGKIISAKDEAPGPYSPRQTCGKCHDYEKISGGWHFNAADPSAPAGRRGEPWILADVKTGTQLPFSSRNWPGLFTPAQLGLTPWTLVTQTGHHLPGGGWGEKFSDKPADSSARWEMSGKLEIDCLICHSSGGQYDVNERWSQVKEQNFKFAPTVAAGFGTVMGSIKSLPEDWDPMAPPNLDHPEQAPPKLTYNKSIFDAKDRVLFTLTRRVQAERCYFCHTTQLVGDGAPPDWQADQDIHLAAGLTCVDCHRNNLGHRIFRGREPGESGDAQDMTLTCRGCHMGPGNAGGPTTAGRLAAPYPKHKGIPTVHLEKLACTACHSGPRPNSSTLFTQTALAHTLGISSTTRHSNDGPWIGVVMAKNRTGQIAPSRMVWPSYWGRLKDDQIAPILPAAAAKALGDILAAKDAHSEQFRLPSAEQIAKGLKALGTDAAGEAVYVKGGKAYRLVKDSLVAFDHAAAKPYLWSLAHDVRPAQQSLGAGGRCVECHSANSGFLFGKVLTEFGQDPVTAKDQCEYEGQEPVLARNFAMSFVFRPYLKIAGFTACAIVAAVLALYGLLGLVAVLKRIGKETN